MSEITVFENPDLGTVRHIVIDDQPWFVLSDVAKILGHHRVADAKEHLRDSQFIGASASIAADLGQRGGKPPTLITESGLYRLMLKSQASNAEPFQIWVEDEVLPSIRKTGSYAATQAAPMDLIDSLELNLALAKQVAEIKPRAELLDLFEDRREGFSVADAGALFGYRPRQFNAVMLSMGATVNVEGYESPLPSDFWIMKGWMTSRNNGRTPVITVEGLAAIERKLGMRVIPKKSTLSESDYLNQITDGT